MVNKCTSTPESDAMVGNSKSQIPSLKFQVSNSKSQIPSLKFQVLLSMPFKPTHFSFPLGIWILEFGSWNFHKCTVLNII